MYSRRSIGFAIGALVALAGCSSGSQPPLPVAQNANTVSSLLQAGSGKIKHIVYIVQEGRSFNTLFEGYPGTVSIGEISSGKKVKLEPVSLGERFILNSGASNMFADCNGTGKLPGTDCRMNGFDRESQTRQHGIEYPSYVYVTHEDSKPYFDMADEWVVADKMFASQLDGDFVAHQYIIAAQAARATGVPDGLWACSARDTIATLTDRRRLGPYERACFNYETLGDELDEAKLSWRFYTSRLGRSGSGGGAYWSSYASVKHIVDGPDWKKDVISPQKRFFTDVADGKLANFTWVTPICADSDQANCGGGYGPSWVAALVNTVGESKFWDSTAIFVQWDDWGGFYDHVPPSYLNFDSLGFRVPLLVISPYAKRDYVSHVHYETASVLRFAEDVYGLDRLTAADMRAASPAADCFDFSQKPRKFVPIKAPEGVKFFLHQSDG